MRACIYEEYGPADVVRVAEIDRPAPGPGELLVKVAAAAVTTADWRFRSANFPGGFALAGRLMLGLRRPRHPVLGMDFAGEVAALGAGVTEFAVGDRVFGSAPRGAHAEYLVVRAAGPVLRTPPGLSDEDAAALPFGGNSALAFVRDVAAVRPGQRVLIIGASGGVGSFAVQHARRLGAEVTAVVSAGNLEFVRGLGAARALDYAQGPYLEDGAGYDVVIDTLGVTTFATARRALTPTGRYVPVTARVREIGEALLTRVRRGPRVCFAITANTRAALAENAALVVAGELRPVIDSVYPLERVADAHRRVEGRHKRGSVLLRVGA